MSDSEKDESGSGDERVDSEDDSTPKSLTEEEKKIEKMVDEFKNLSIGEQRRVMNRLNITGMLTPNDHLASLMTMSTRDVYRVAGVLIERLSREQNDRDAERQRQKKTTAWNLFMRSCFQRFKEEWKEKKLSFKEKMNIVSELWAKQKEHILQMNDSDMIGPSNDSDEFDDLDVKSWMDEDEIGQKPVSGPSPSDVSVVCNCKITYDKVVTEQVIFAG